MQFALKREFRQLREFQELQQKQPELFSDLVTHIVVQHSLLHGIRSDFLGYVPSHEVRVIGDEPREHLFARGLNSRQRMILDLTTEYGRERGIADVNLRIYGHEALTTLALMLRGRYPRFIGTEFCRTAKEREDLFPIRHGNVCASDWPDAVFDVVLSADVLEHVPSIDEALCDTARILRPGGRMIATLPLLFEHERGARLAELRGGEIIYYVDPIYHGNPMDPDGGSLVFEIPGWDLIERGMRAGFADSRFLFWLEQDRGFVTAGEGRPTRPRGLFAAIFDR